jgi:hypothetical protein
MKVLVQRLDYAQKTGVCHPSGNHIRTLGASVHAGLTRANLAASFIRP